MAVFFEFMDRTRLWREDGVLPFLKTQKAHRFGELFEWSRRDSNPRPAKETIDPLHA